MHCYSRPNYLLLLGTSIVNMHHEVMGQRTGLFKWLHDRNLILINKNRSATCKSPGSSKLSTLDLTLISHNLLDYIGNWWRSF